ncbi:sunset domain-containing protein [Levilactobacillus humaensis]|uniref:sunset domain-containing protein n=1 Tax=Levilactobacillus humaensis TaxID=2950375 RepID=UPI0021C35920|nr:hypothetical protein [Levilactobacillus humaensis]
MRRLNYLWGLTAAPKPKITRSKEVSVIIFLLICILLGGYGVWWAFFKTTKRHWIIGILGVLVILLGFGGLGSTGDSAAPKTKTIKVGTARLAKAQAESSRLADSASQQSKASAALDDQSSSLAASASSVAKAKKASQKQAASEAASARKAETATSQAAATSASSHKTHRGNLNTSQRGKIIGNRNSKIYHTADQAGYRMNSQNAVYFQTEAQAQAAGYRKARR